MTVKHTHADYDRMSCLWERCRDAVKGQAALHAKSEVYLPKLRDESMEAYGYPARLKRSDFGNYTWRTISGLVGMAFNKEPVKALPGVLEGYSKDITMSGVNLDALAERVVEEVLEVGRCGLLVDHPVLPANVSAITIKAAEEMGNRPNIKFYAAEYIRNWRFKSINHSWKLDMVVLGECEWVQKDEFESEAEDRYRVLDLDEGGFYRQRLYKVKDGEDVLLEGPTYPLMNNQPMREIPFAIIGRSGMGDDIDEPPLIDLVDANLAHYQINSDYRHGLHYTAMPTLFLAGIQEEEGKSFYIGGSAAITSNHPDAKGMFIEYTGQGLGAISTALKELEQRMAVLGARMIADETNQVETLGATQIKRAGENSILARIVIAASEAIEWALGIMAKWSNVSGKVKYEINREFGPVGLDAQKLNSLLQNVIAGKISDREYFDLLQRADIIDGQKDFVTHQAEIGDMQTLPRPEPDNDDQGIAA